MKELNLSEVTFFIWWEGTGMGKEEGVNLVRKLRSTE